MELTHEHRLTAVEEKVSRCEGRIDSLEEEQSVLHDLVTAVAVMAEQLKTMNQNVDGLTAKVDALESKPAKRWDGIIDKLVAAAVGAFFAWILAGGTV